MSTVSASSFVTLTLRLVNLVNPLNACGSGGWLFSFSLNSGWASRLPRCCRVLRWRRGGSGRLGEGHAATDLTIFCPLEGGVPKTQIWEHRLSPQIAGIFGLPRPRLGGRKRAVSGTHREEFRSQVEEGERGLVRTVCGWDEPVFVDTPVPWLVCVWCDADQLLASICANGDQLVGTRAVSSSNQWRQGVGTRRWSSSNQFWTRMICCCAPVSSLSIRKRWPSGETSNAPCA